MVVPMGAMVSSGTFVRIYQHSWDNLPINIDCSDLALLPPGGLMSLSGGFFDFIFYNIKYIYVK